MLLVSAGAEGMELRASSGTEGPAEEANLGYSRLVATDSGANAPRMKADKGE